MASAESRWTDTAPWCEVQAHLLRTDTTASKVRAPTAKTPRAFEGLRDRLHAFTDELEDCPPKA